MNNNKCTILPTYILKKDGEAVLEPDITRWAEWFARSELRVLKQDAIGKGVMVSTVFLGIDHNFVGGGAPLLWETAIFSGSHCGYQRRYATRKEALAAHTRALKIAKTKAKRR